MCLGDSITDGFWLPGGYRNTLCTMLSASGMADRVTFVGPNCGGTGYAPFHAGFVGFSVDSIAADASLTGTRAGILPLVPMLTAQFPADVILLQIGTNDILSRHALPQFGERLGRLTDALLDALPACRLLALATLPDIDTARCPYIDPQVFPAGAVDAAVSDCNAQIRQLTAAAQKAGKPVLSADIHSALTKADLRDGVHPAASGYEKIGRYWFRFLTAQPFLHPDR